MIKWAPFPFLRYLIFFTAGILSAPFLGFNSSTLFLFLFCGYVILTQFARKRLYTFSLLFGILGLCIFFLGGATLRQNYDRRSNPILIKEFLNKGNSYLILIDNPVEKTAKGFKTTAKIKAYGQPGNWNPCDYKVWVFTRIPSQIETGNLYLLQKPPTEIKNSDTPDFDFKKYYNNQGIYLNKFLNKNELKWISTYHLSPIIKWANFLKQNIEESLNSGFKNRNVEALLKAITVGVKSDIDSEVKAGFASTGTMHVLAVSGLHVGIFYGIFLFLFQGLLKSRYRHFIVIFIIGILWFYALLTGFTPSVLRAVTMFSILALGKSFKRRSNTYNLVFVSAFLLLAIDPNLLFSLGFQLSYAAVLSILFFTPKFMRLPLPYWFPHNVKTLLVVSTSAQLGTLPLSLFYFKQLPAYFLLSNLIVIPLIFILLNSTILYLVLAFITPVQEFVGFIIDKVTSLLLFIVETISHFPGAVYSTNTFTFTEMLILYGFIISLSVFFIKKKFRLLIISFCILLSFTFLRMHFLSIFYHS